MTRSSTGSRFLPVVLALVLGAAAFAFARPALASAASTATAIVQPADSPPPRTAPRPQPTGLMAAADRTMGTVNAAIGSVLFFDLIFWDPARRLPFIVGWLVVGAVFLTLRMGFINLRAFRHAVAVTAGKYTDPGEPGDVSHLDALSTALSATVGLGKIAGVAIAVSLGGPGTTFWMIVAGLFGMTAKFTECTLGQMYRDLGNGQRGVLGGPVQREGAKRAGCVLEGLPQGGVQDVHLTRAVWRCRTCHVRRGSFGAYLRSRPEQERAAVYSLRDRTISG